MRYIGFSFLVGVLICYSFVLSNKLTPFVAGQHLAETDVQYINNESAFPRKIIDPIGRNIVLEKPPQRIVSGVLAGDEYLSSLVDIERIKSVTYLVDDQGISNIPNYYPESISRNRGTIEEYIELQPDLVIVASYSNATSVKMLLETGIPIIRFTRYHSHEDIRHNVRKLARALGKEKDAELWINLMDKRIDQVKQQVKDLKKPRVLYYSLSGSSSGPGSLMHESIEFAGGKNVIAELGYKGYTKLSPEMAISLMPEVILINGWNSGNISDSAKNILINNPAWKDVPAVKNNRVYELSGAWLTSGSPYRVKGIEKIAALLHPQLLNDKQGVIP